MLESLNRLFETILCFAKAQDLLYMHLLLTPPLSSPQLLESLNRLFETILRFAKAQDLLYMHLLEQRAAANQLGAEAAANTAGGRQAILVYYLTC